MMSDLESQSIQISPPETVTLEPRVNSVSERAYDPSRDRERWRGRLAAALVYSLILLIAASFLGLITRTISVEELKEFAPLFIAPLAGLVGVALGYYFGRR
jgi:hypothetical protein